MSSKFFPNKTALITLIAACFVVNVTMGVRQTFGLFSGDFEIDCGISNTEFGLAIALHALIWGIVTPIFGRFADKHGGSKMVIFTLIIYGVGVLALGNNFNTGSIISRCCLHRGFRRSSIYRSCESCSAKKYWFSNFTNE